MMTDPSFRGLFVITENPEIGPLGVRPGIDQSDSLHSPGILCRDVVDFPSYRGSFKSISQMLSRGGAASVSLDVGRLVLHNGEDASILVIQGERFDISMISTMENALENFSYERDGSDPWKGKRIAYPNPEAKERVLVLDLGIREGVLRALRKVSTVTTLPARTELWDDVFEFDRALISSGPGVFPNPELVGTVSGFLELCGERPVFAMGIGALAANIALGGNPEKLEKPHRGCGIESRVGRILLPTYQNHEHSLSPLEGFEGSCPGPDGSPEVLSSRRDPSRILSTMDTLPEFGMVEEDPLAMFLRGDR